MTDWEGLIFAVVLVFLLIRIVKDGKLTVDHGIEANDGLTARQAQRLQLIVNDIEQMMIVP